MSTSGIASGSPAIHRRHLQSLTLVTVSSPDLETMNALTAAVDMDAMAHGSLVLGAVEGTQSQVVDVSDPYLVTSTGLWLLPLFPV
jgi:hypothetical protein